MALLFVLLIEFRVQVADHIAIGVGAIVVQVQAVLEFREYTLQLLGCDARIYLFEYVIRPKSEGNLVVHRVLDELELLVAENRDFLRMVYGQHVG